MTHTNTAAGNGSRNDPALEIQRHIDPDDWALVMSFNGPLPPSTKTSDWGEFGFDGRVVFAGIEFDKNRQMLLRRHQVVGKAAEAWRAAFSEIALGVARVSDRCSGRLHLFFAGPYGAAAYLGRCLDEDRRLRRPTFVHHLDHRGAGARLFLLPQECEKEIGSQKFFNPHPPRTVSGLSGGFGCALSIEVRRDVDETLLRDLAIRERLSCVYRMIPKGTRWLDSPAVAHGALKQIRYALDFVRERNQGAPLHLATSAPVALIVALCREFSANVYPRVIVHHYAPAWGPGKTSPGGAHGAIATHRYFPVVEIIEPSVVSVHSNRLEIFLGDGGMLMYQLNGEVMPAARLVPDCPRIVDRRSAEKQAVMSQSREFSQKVLSPGVDSKISNFETLDIEISLPDEPAELPWEFLFSSQQDTPVAIVQGWSLARFIESKGQIRDRDSSQPLKILIAVGLDPVQLDKLAPRLRLNTLVQNLRKRGAQVELLAPIKTHKQIPDAMKTFQPDVFHWIGHGGPDALFGFPPITEVSTTGRVVMLDRLQFKMLMDEAPPPRVVLLASCELGSEVEEFGVPRNLIAEGVGAVISFRDTVRVGEVSCFAEAFYEAVLEGASIREGVTRGRRALYNDQGNLIMPGAFGAPVLTCAHRDGLVPLVAPPLSGAASADEGAGAAPDGAAGDHDVSWGTGDGNLGSSASADDDRLPIEREQASIGERQKRPVGRARDQEGVDRGEGERQRPGEGHGHVPPQAGGARETSDGTADDDRLPLELDRDRREAPDD